jgi:hypothetical protein
MPLMTPEWEEYALLLRVRRRDQFGPRSKIVRLRRLLEHWPPPTAAGETADHGADAAAERGTEIR